MALGPIQKAGGPTRLSKLNSPVREEQRALDLNGRVVRNILLKLSMQLGFKEPATPEQVQTLFTLVKRLEPKLYEEIARTTENASYKEAETLARRIIEKMPAGRNNITSYAIYLERSAQVVNRYDRPNRRPLPEGIYRPG